MRSRTAELQPAREFVQRMHALEAELERARHERRRLGHGSGSANRWGLDQPVQTEHEDSWFVTYLDMMTLMLVAIIVMLAFAGTMNRKGHAEPPANRSTIASIVGEPDASVMDAAKSATIPLPDTSAPYPAAPTAEFMPQVASQPTLGPLAGTFPPLDAPAVSAPVTALPVSTIPDTTDPALVASTPRSAMPAAPSEPASQRAVPLVAAAQTPQPSADLVAAHRPDTSGATAQPSSPASIKAPETPAVAEKPVDATSEGASLAAALPLGGLGSEVEVIVNKRTVSLRVNSEILFDPGQADLSRHGLSVLKRMAQVLTKKGYDLTIEGHTDSVPLRASAKYPSNWELSSARASSVVRYLQTNGIDKTHLKAVGYADTRPIGDNHDPDGRARNRRVELVIEKAQADEKPAPPIASTQKPGNPG
ncbi:MAG: OmpA family protein [Castellaniella sp.]|nr:OmpA family protein [Castellaniella sp.]